MWSWNSCLGLQMKHADPASKGAWCYSAWGPNADRHHKSLIDLPSVGSMLGADSHSGPPGCGKTLCAEPFVPSFARYRSAHSF